MQLIDSNNSVLIINPVLIEQDPLKVKTNGRPPSLLKKELIVQEAEFEDSTCRKVSRFEYEGVSRDRDIQWGRSKPRGTSKGRPKKDLESETHDVEEVHEVKRVHKVEELK